MAARDTHRDCCFMRLPFLHLACPLDGAPLRQDGAVWCCPSGHSFDSAREGYINLLPVQNKRSRDPGDSKEMVAARRRFLDAGHYQPIASTVARMVLDGLPERAACLDAGCGEGYYLRRLADAAHGRQLALLGLDISKWAVQAAARQQRDATWVVGSNANLPVLAQTLDRVICMFGFPVYGEFARVLKPGGELLQVDAGADHLRELREVIYSEPEAGAPLRTAGASRLHGGGNRDLALHGRSGGLSANRRPAADDAAPVSRNGGRARTRGGVDRAVADG